MSTITYWAKLVYGRLTRVKLGDDGAGKAAATSNAFDECRIQYDAAGEVAALEFFKSGKPAANPQLGVSKITISRGPDAIDVHSEIHENSQSRLPRR
jgi:hypothetical protein